MASVPLFNSPLIEPVTHVMASSGALIQRGDRVLLAAHSIYIDELKKQRYSCLYYGEMSKDQNLAGF